MTSTTHKRDDAGGAFRDSPLNIRAATPADLPRLTEILAESFHSRAGLAGLMYPIFRLGIYEDLRNRLSSASGYYACLVATIPKSRSLLGPLPPNATEQLLGTVEMGLRSSSPWSMGDRYPYLSNLAVHPSFRRRGVAQALLTRCEQTALQWGFSSLHLHVLENNNQARQLYFRAGYRLEEVSSGWDSLFFSQPRRLFLSKPLSPP
ncbi:MAG: GNAT family N-acetyltransferase [Limnospira sp.]